MRQLIHDYKEFTVNLRGLRVIFFINSGLCLSKTPFNAPDMHSHYHGELFSVFEGEMKLVVGEDAFTLQRGEVILIPKNLMHKPTYSDDIFRVSIAFSIQGKASVGSVISEKFYSIAEKATPTKLQNTMISDCLRRIVGYYYGESDFKDEAIAGCLQELVALICSDNGVVEANSPSYIDESKNYRKYAVQEYFTVRLRDGIYDYDSLSLEELCSILGLSEKQTQRTVKNVFGRTFREEILYLRMNKASELLRMSEYGINKIAVTLGYSGTRSFYKHFKEAFGVTPSEYRRSYLKK